MDQETEKLLTRVRDNFLLMQDIVADKQNQRYDEHLLNTAIITPICAVGMAYTMFQTIDKDYFRHKTKKWYNEIRDKFRSIYSESGALHKGLSVDEIIALSDYREMVEKEMKHDSEILWWQLQSKVMDIPQPHRDMICKLIYIVTVNCYTTTILSDTYHVPFQEAEYITFRACRAAEEIRTQLYGKEVKPIAYQLDDAMFKRTLHVLFGHMTRIGNGEHIKEE